eukprot:COSAG04_NODE_366_length_15829_cov_10.434075_10_plen_276_part_00
MQSGTEDRGSAGEVELRTSSFWRRPDAVPGARASHRSASGSRTPGRGWAGQGSPASRSPSCLATPPDTLAESGAHGDTWRRHLDHPNDTQGAMGGFLALTHPPTTRDGIRRRPFANRTSSRRAMQLRSIVDRRDPPWRDALASIKIPSAGGSSLEETCAAAGYEAAELPLGGAGAVALRDELSQLGRGDGVLLYGARNTSWRRSDRGRPDAQRRNAALLAVKSRDARATASRAPQPGRLARRGPAQGPLGHRSGRWQPALGSRVLAAGSRVSAYC